MAGHQRTNIAQREAAADSPTFGDGRRLVPIGDAVFRFRIELPLYDDDRVGDDPQRTVTRLLEVPASFNFWELHIAIQDAMGWLDYHLHEFRIPTRAKGDEAVLIGIPGDDDELEVLEGWTVLVRTYAKAIQRNEGITYLYDFGDGWRHHIFLETELRSDGGLYPRCLAGQWACPPEDCGGATGYYEKLRISQDRTDEDYRSTRDWLGNYKPDVFKAAKVHFDNPKLRFEYAML